jgi:hypothetical protein
MTAGSGQRESAVPAAARPVGAAERPKVLSASFGNDFLDPDYLRPTSIV